MDWDRDMDPESKKAWGEFVEHARTETLSKIAGSNAFISITPTGDDVDIKYAVELGLAIMLDKPILVVAMPGAKLPQKLRDVADAIAIGDIDTDVGRQVVAAEIKRFMEALT